jgi:hypothetical protein
MDTLDALLERSRDADGGLRLTGKGSVLGDMIKAVLQRALEGELSAHLGYGKHDRTGNNSGNSRNGATGKTVQTGVGPVRLSVPRDRAGTFEPVLVPKRVGRISGGLDDMTISLYAHGMTVRDILHHLNQVYGTELSPEQVSAITDGVLEEVRAWQNRPLDAFYAILYVDALMVKIRDGGSVDNRAAYLVTGVDADGFSRCKASGWPRPRAPGSGEACSLNCHKSGHRLSAVMSASASKPGPVGQQQAVPSRRSAVVCYTRRHPSTIVSSLMGWAGFPAARTRGGRLPLTTDPAATTVPSPILLPGSTVTLRPSQTLEPITTGANFGG